MPAQFTHRSRPPSPLRRRRDDRLGLGLHAGVAGGRDHRGALDAAPGAGPEPGSSTPSRLAGEGQRHAGAGEPLRRRVADAGAASDDQRMVLGRWASPFRSGSRARRALRSSMDHLRDGGARPGAERADVSRHVDALRRAEILRQPPAHEDRRPQLALPEPRDEVLRDPGARPRCARVSATASAAVSAAAAAMMSSSTLVPRSTTSQPRLPRTETTTCEPVLVDVGGGGHDREAAEVDVAFGALDALEHVLLTGKRAGQRVGPRHWPEAAGEVGIRLPRAPQLFDARGAEALGRDQQLHRVIHVHSERRQPGHHARETRRPPSRIRSRSAWTGRQSIRGRDSRARRSASLASSSNWTMSSAVGIRMGSVTGVAWTAAPVGWASSFAIVKKTLTLVTIAAWRSSKEAADEQDFGIAVDRGRGTRESVVEVQRLPEGGLEDGGSAKVDP